MGQFFVSERIFFSLGQTNSKCHVAAMHPSLCEEGCNAFTAGARRSHASLRSLRRRHNNDSPTSCACIPLTAGFALHTRAARISGIPLVAGGALSARVARVARIALGSHRTCARTKRERCQQKYGRY